MPAVPDAAADAAVSEMSSDADDDNETPAAAATRVGVATGAAGATTVNERPGPTALGHRRPNREPSAP